MIPLDLNKIKVQTIDAPWLDSKNICLDVLRLDLIHPVISGNKYFKLKYYLHDALENGYESVATFGGAWSNHISAFAYTCKLAGIQSIGIIRGERSAILSATLTEAQNNGMELHFVTREMYKNKPLIKETYQSKNWYWIDEGGFGSAGAKGAKEILDFVVDQKKYTHIAAAVGTGTMLAGLINAAAPHINILGISSMKNNNDLEINVETLVIENGKKWSINHDYHFGGYGKTTPLLIHFMNEIYNKHQLPLDIIYTSKLMFAIQDLAGKNSFTESSKLLMIHSGGLQGNRSLAPQVLAF